MRKFRLTCTYIQHLLVLLEIYYFLVAKVLYNLTRILHVFPLAIFRLSRHIDSLFNFHTERLVLKTNLVFTELYYFNSRTTKLGNLNKPSTLLEISTCCGTLSFPIKNVFVMVCAPPLKYNSIMFLSTIP